MMLQKYLWGLGALVTSALLLTSGQVAAQGQSASAAAMLEEIVVTARRREENLQELPLSIQAISADAMQAQGIYNMEQLTDFVPNVVLTEDQRQNDTRLFIRGIGGGFSNPAQVFGVGLYIDGHYQSGTLGAFMSTLDIERIEILRGPQGTLFGKNTTGGAISIISAKPGPEFDSYVTLRAAEYGQTDIRAMINAPITDNLFFRGNYASETLDGYYFNRFLNIDAGDTDQESYGLALRWEAGDNWTIDARLASSRDRDGNGAAQCRAYPDQEMYDYLIGALVNDANGDPIPGPGTPANPQAFAGPDRVLGTFPGDPFGVDDIVYTGPGPFASGNDAWGGSNDDTSLRTINFGPGGSDLRLDAQYPGANVDYLASCDVDFSSGDIRQMYQDYNVRSNVDNDWFNINAVWESDGAVGPFESVGLQIQTGSRHTEYVYQQDRDYGPGIIDHIGNHPNPGSRGIQRNTDEFEVIFTGEIGDRASLTLGAYWFDDVAQAGNSTCLSRWIAAWDENAGPIDPLTGRPEGTVDGLPPAGQDIICIPEGGTFFHRLPDTPGDKQSSFNSGKTSGESKAVFGHVVFHLNEMWDLGVGARAMEDTRGQAHIETGITPGSCNQTRPLEMCDPEYIMSKATLIDGGIFANLSAKFDEVTPMVSVTRFLTPGNTLDSGMFYATIAEGWLMGAFNDEINPNAPAFDVSQREQVLAKIPYGPESVTNYEFGFKGTLFDGRLTLAADVFLMDYTDKQEEIRIDNSDGRFGPALAFEFTENASDVEITGIELELRASPWDGGFISVDFGYLDSDYDNFVVEDLDNLGTFIDRSNELIANRTPDWTLTASVEHAFLLGNGATLTPQIGLYAQPDFEWRSGRLVDDPDHPLCHQDDYTKWRARLTYVPQEGDWQASFFGYNITDEEILFRCAPGRSGAFVSYYEAPERWGAEFTMHFGRN